MRQFYSSRLKLFSNNPAHQLSPILNKCRSSLYFQTSRLYFICPIFPTNSKYSPQSFHSYSDIAKKISPIEYEIIEEDSDDEQEYIPEVDWDHTKAAVHIKRGYSAESSSSNSIRERVYDGFLTAGVFAALVGVFGMIAFAIFSWLKMKKQLSYVVFAQKRIRKMRQKYKIMPEIRNVIPLDIETMDVTPIKDVLSELSIINNDELYITLEDLNSNCLLWKTLVVEYELPINDIISFDKNDMVALEDVTYFLALLQYFLGQARRKGTPSVRRQVRDDIYKMLNTFDGNTDFVSLKNMGSYASACFSLAILSPPNLGNRKIGGQTLDEFKVNYVLYMMREPSKPLTSEITLRRFNFLYKICDFGIGLTPETRGQLAK